VGAVSLTAGRQANRDYRDWKVPPTGRGELLFAQSANHKVHKGHKESLKLSIVIKLLTQRRNDVALILQSKI